MHFFNKRTISYGLSTISHIANYRRNTTGSGTGPTRTLAGLEQFFLLCLKLCLRKDSFLPEVIEFHQLGI